MRESTTVVASSSVVVTTIFSVHFRLSSSVYEPHIKDVRRARDTRIVGAHEHLESQRDLLIALMQYLGYKFRHVVFNIVEVLVCRDDAVGVLNDTLIVNLVVMNENPPRHFDSADAVSCLHGNPPLLVHADKNDLVIEYAVLLKTFHYRSCVLQAMNGLYELCCRV